MQNIKKYFMTLALLLTAVTGAWAQTAFGVVEFEVPADWETAQSNVTAADLPGFKASTLDEVNAWGAPAEGYALLFYAFDGENASYVFFKEGSPMPMSNTPTPYKKIDVFNNSKSVKFYYTTELTEWELTSKDGKNWILDKMPANDIELQVEYYAESNLFLGKEALANKANISVLNGETAVDFDADGKSTTTITEGTAMTVKYTGTKKVLGVKAEKVTYAEGHALSSSVVGELVGSDGKAYAAADKENLPRGVTAVALVCYKNGSNGLALALADESSQMSWDSAITTCAAKTPTITGGIWKLASQDEWNQMINAVGGYAALRDGFSTVGGDNLKSNEYYWSSTQEDSISGREYSFTSHNWGWAGKDTQECVRACLAF